MLDTRGVLFLVTSNKKCFHHSAHAAFPFRGIDSTLVFQIYLNKLNKKID